MTADLRTCFGDCAPLLKEHRKAVTSNGQRTIIHEEINRQIGQIVLQLLEAHYDINSPLHKHPAMKIDTAINDDGEYLMIFVPANESVPNERWFPATEALVKFTKEFADYVADDKKIGLQANDIREIRYNYRPRIMIDALQNMFEERFFEHAVLQKRFNTIDVLLSRLGDDDSRFFKMAQQLH